MQDLELFWIFFFYVYRPTGENNRTCNLVSLAGNATQESRARNSAAYERQFHKDIEMSW